MLIKKQKIPFVKIAIFGFLPSFVKKTIYRIQGYKIGSNVSIGLGSIIISNKVEIKDNVKIGFLCVIRSRELVIDRFVKIGTFTFIEANKISIGEDTRINENVIIGGVQTSESEFKIGKRGIVMEYSFLNTSYPLIIGDDTGIGGHCLLFTHGSWLNKLDGFPVKFAGITLGNNVWLPWRVFIMPGVTIGNNVVIGAESMVSSGLPSNCLAAGNPAKVIKENYPTPLSPEKRNIEIESMINEFIKYLDFNGLSIREFVNDEDGISFLCVNEKFYYAKKSKALSSDFILIDNNKFSNNDFINTKMIANLHTKERIGKSNLGEEFLYFISRFGIRLNRQD